MIVRDGVDYESLDDEPAHLFFLIAAPAGGANVHLEVLSRLSRMLMDDDFRDNLMKAQTPEEYLAIIDKAEAEQVAAEEAEAAAEAAAEEAPAETETAAPSDRPYVIGVTACPTGIAHTYMAAEALENKATAMGVDIKIETNGSGGVKNHLTQADIDRAVGVIVACDKDVPVQRLPANRSSSRKSPTASRSRKNSSRPSSTAKPPFIRAMNRRRKPSMSKALKRKRRPSDL